MAGIPDRWLAYTAMGQAIAGTKFICFKVPLKKALNNSLGTEERFSPDMLLEKCPDLGLVIDLTNTKRYYNNLEFLSRGVYYKKIFCPGRVVPPLNLVSQFIKNVDDFLNKTQDKLIGVHCTHGVNRTGYFVCSYMIRRLGMSPQDAISEFEKARGHRIERDFYVEELQNGSDKELPPPENQEEEGMTGNAFDGPGPRKKERYRNRNRGDGRSSYERPHSADKQNDIGSDIGFQGGHFNHDRSSQRWQQCSDRDYGGYRQFREPYHRQGKPAYRSAPPMSSSSEPNRVQQEHISPLSGAYDDHDQPSFSRYGNRQGPVKNYQGHRSSIDGPNRDRSNTRQNNKYHWHRRGGSQNSNSDRS